MAIALPQYSWLVVVGSFAAFAFGWATGSNDVANAFGTSVGAKTLTLKQAVLIAAIFEFVGALVLGRVTANTIAGGIADINIFKSSPEAYAYGMVCALTTSFMWNGLASYLEMNVSSTHSIIASIMGFSYVWGGKDGINWVQSDSKSFPPYKGVVPIIVSWFFSPILSAFASALIMLTCRTFVLRRQNSTVIAIWFTPIAVAFTTWINLYFVFTKGAKKTLETSDNKWSDTTSAWVSLICSVVLCALVSCTVCPYLYKKSKAQDIESPSTLEITNVNTEIKNEEHASTEIVPDTIITVDNKFQSFQAKIKNALLKGVNVDIHDSVESDPIVNAIHQNVEKFDPKAEFVFSWLQVFSAICVIFAHGANEVGYMAGPLATIWDIYNNGKMVKTVNPPIWVILISAFGLVVGLATYGYNITRAVGIKMAKLSPSRGFAAELATALVILTASQYGLPTSSSQCITGAIVGVGLLEGVTKGVNWRFFSKQFASWVLTMFVVSISTGLLFAQGVYSPSIESKEP
jgi:sodium-dependent phosphate transporter